MQQATLFETDDPAVAYQQAPPVQPQPIQKQTNTNGRFLSLNEKTYAEGGAVEETNRLFQDGGMMQEGGTVDPVSGNEVPVGAMQEEVRDDIDAKLSEGEFVFPADVVRFIGLEKLMKMRDQAKQGLQRMDEMGQMGNAEEVGATPNEMFEESDTFETDMNGIIDEVDAEEQFAVGGLAGTDLAKAPKNPSIDTRYFKHADGRVMYIVFVNDKPSVKVPEGFEPMDGPVEQQVGKVAEEKAATGAVAADAGGGAELSDTTPNYYQAKEDSLVAKGMSREDAKAQISKEQAARNSKINNMLTKAVNNSLLFKAIQTVSDAISKGVEDAQMGRVAQSVVSGETSIQGSPFGSMSEANAVATNGWGSDAHFDAIEATYNSLPSSADKAQTTTPAPSRSISTTPSDSSSGGDVGSIGGVSLGGGDPGGYGYGTGGFYSGGLASKKKKKSTPRQTATSLAARK